MTSRYRPDIDGLRALAVVAVILYHFKFIGFAGGFVGVDVFFVISGFLIASLIDGELAEGRFRLLHFFERRVRRIFPALIVLLFVVNAVAYVEFFPVTYLRFGQSVASTSVFLSNVEFWREGDDYFGIPSQERPLLHTWSLAVEEQFYLLFPLLLMLLARYPRRWTISVLVAIVALSLGFSMWSAYSSPLTGFYLFPSRIWELLLGALLAVGAFPAVSNRWTDEALSVSGLAMIAGAIALYTPSTPFPGLAALLPCVGAGLIVHAGLRGRPTINRFLSMRPVVFVGLISYSLYLWHWPLYVFATYHLARELSVLESVCLIAASVVIAALSWRFVEQPFRRPGGVTSRRQIFLLGGATMSVLGASGVAIYLTNGVPQRFTPDVQALLAPQTYYERPGCERERGEQTTAGPMCRIGRPGGPVTFLVWGDSHAGALAPAVARSADRLGYSGLLVTRGGCAPLLRDSSYRDPEGCRRHNEAIFKFLRANKIPEIILIGRWTIHAEGTNYLKGGQFRELELEERHRDFSQSLNRTVDLLRANGNRVTIVGPVPEIGLDVPTTLARRRMSGLPEDIGPIQRQFADRNKTVLDLLVSMDESIERVYPHLMLCTEVRCAVAHEGKPLYFDNNHLDRFGAETISAIFDPVFTKTH